jgi:hypothetical protein
VDTRVRDALFGQGVVKALPETDPTYTGPGARLLSSYR